MKILFVSSEVLPFASTGGLGDVAAALPKALVQQGVEVVRVMPLYGDIDRARYQIEPCNVEVHVPLGGTWHKGTVWTQESEGVTTYFIYNDHFFGRHGIYSFGEHGYDDNFERFLFFQKAVVQLIDQWDLQPDVVHCNDWPTGLIPMLLRYGIAGRYRGGNEKTLFTIHNLAHQGWARADKFLLTGLPWECYTMHTLEFYNEVNPMKGGIVAATAINAVSPSYAQEIQTPEFGSQLDGVLRARSHVLHGILNGVDYSRWNPETDTYIAANYSADDLSGKVACKRALQKAAGLKEDPDVPILGIITRLVPQKGIDLLDQVIDRVMQKGVQLVLLGTGDARYEHACREWVKRWPDQICSWIEFSQEKAHWIEAGADIFLMPSQFEPCGQNQLFSMRYGTIPVVRGVGGLEDSVVDAAVKGGTGFKFYGYTAEIFAASIERALKSYAKRSKWTSLMKHAMQQDFSVVHMAREYIELYHLMGADDGVD